MYLLTALLTPSEGLIPNVRLASCQWEHWSRPPWCAGNLLRSWCFKLSLACKRSVCSVGRDGAAVGPTVGRRVLALWQVCKLGLIPKPRFVIRQGGGSFILRETGNYGGLSLLKHFETQEITLASGIPLEMNS